MKNIKIFSVIILVCLVGSLHAEIEKIVSLPENLENGLIGMRVSADRAFIMNQKGQYIRVDVNNKEALRGNIDSDSIIDFDLILGRIIYLDSKGRLKGRTQSIWQPQKRYNACQIEVSDQGLFLTGADVAYFLPQNASETIEIPGLNFVVPINHGFAWKLEKENTWRASLINVYGYEKKEIYRFTDRFNPTGIRVGPKGPEGELLITFYENNIRSMVLIGNNGHMFWRLDGPEGICRRDVAFDSRGRILFLDRDNDGKIWLFRWTPEIPKG